MTGSWIPVFGSIVQALYGAAFCFSHQNDRKRIFSRLPVLPPQIHAHCSKMMQEILTDIFLSKRYNGYTNDISGISPQSLPAYPNVRRLQPRIFSNYPEKSAGRTRAERYAGRRSAKKGRFHHAQPQPTSAPPSHPRSTHSPGDRRRFSLRTAPCRYIRGNHDLAAAHRHRRQPQRTRCHCRSHRQSDLLYALQYHAGQPAPAVCPGSRGVPAPVETACKNSRRHGVQHRHLCVSLRHCRLPGIPRQRRRSDRLHHDCGTHRLCLLFYARRLFQRPQHRQDSPALHRRMRRRSRSHSGGGSIQLLRHPVHERRLRHQHRSHTNRGKEVPVCRRRNLRRTDSLRRNPGRTGCRTSHADPAGGRSAGGLSLRKKPISHCRCIFPVLSDGAHHLRDKSAPGLRCHQPVSGQRSLSVPGQQLAGQVAYHRPARPL